MELEDVSLSMALLLQTTMWYNILLSSMSDKNTKQMYGAPPTLKSFFALVHALGFFLMIFGGTFAFVFQYVKIFKLKNAVGFSSLVCFSLCIAHSHKLLFLWFGEKFDLAVFAHSFVMIACMLVLLEISVRMSKKMVAVNERKHIWKGDFFNAFWAWHDLFSYLLLLFVIIALSTTLTVIFRNSYTFVQIIGTVPLPFEAFLGVPQFLLNCKRKSVEGLSVKMIVFWLAGDVFSLTWHITHHLPVQFDVCTSIELLIDSFILLQVLFYRKNPPEAKESEH